MFNINWNSSYIRVRIYNNLQFIMFYLDLPQYISKYWCHNNIRFFLYIYLTLFILNRSRWKILYYYLLKFPCTAELFHNINITVYVYFYIPLHNEYIIFYLILSIYETNNNSLYIIHILFQFRLTWTIFILHNMSLYFINK